MLLNPSKGTARHREQDFDTGTHLSDIYIFVTDVPNSLSALYPIPAFAFQM